MKFASTAKLLFAGGIAWYCTRNQYRATHDDLKVIPMMLVLDPSILPLECEMASPGGMTPGVASCQIPETVSKSI